MCRAALSGIKVMDGGHAERGERESDAKAGQDHEDRQQVARRIRAYRAQAENACNKAQDGQNHDVSKRSPGRQHAAAWSPTTPSIIGIRMRPELVADPPYTR